MNIRNRVGKCFSAVSRLGVFWAVKKDAMCLGSALLAILCAYPAVAVQPAIFSVDTLDSPRKPGNVEKITCSTRWNDGGFAKVAVNGKELGNFPAPAETVLDWDTASIPNGEYTFTHSDGVTNLTAKFVIADHRAPVFEINGLTDWTDSVGYRGLYDGKPHGIRVNVTFPPTASVTYSLAGEGPFGTVNPTLTGAGTTTVWFKVEAPYYPTLLTNAVVKINPKPLTADMVSQPADTNYTGAAIEPEVTVNDGTPSVITADDYTIAYSDNKDAGSATVKITGRSNYTGSVTKQFTIKKAEIIIPGAGGGTGSKPDIDPPVNPGLTDPISKYDFVGEYDGVGHTIDTNALNALAVGTSDPLSVTYSLTKDGTYGTDSLFFTNVCATSIWYKISAPNYADYTHEAKVTITNRPISNVTVGTIAKKTYTGSAIEPGVTVTDGDPNIITMDDYTVTYTNNVNAGAEAKAIISATADGNYSGVVTNLFTINRGTMNDGSSSGGTAGGPTVVAEGYEGFYDGGGHSITVRVDNAGSDVFTITYATTETGTYSGTLPLYTNGVSTSVWFRVESPNYETFSGSRTVVIKELACLKAEIGWSFVRATGTYFAQLKVTCTNGMDAGVQKLRFMFADRKSGGTTLASLWNSHPSKRCAVAETKTIGDEAYRYVELDPALIVSEGTEVVYGVSDLSASTVPVAERILELFVAKRVPPAGGNEATAGVNDFVGYLEWETHGQTMNIPLVAGAAGRSLLGSRAFVFAAPVSADALNMAMAVETPIESGESAYCELQEFSVERDAICGRVGVGARGNGSKKTGALGSNATVVLMGARNLGEPFEACGRMEVRADGTFSFPKPEGFRFFKVRLGAEEIVK